MAQTTVGTAPAVAVPGMLADQRRADIITLISSESSAVIPFGTYVCRTSTAGMGKKPTVATDITTGRAGGFCVHQDMHINPSLVTNADRNAFQPKEPMGVATRGYMWVKCYKNWSKDGKVYVRFLTTDTNYTNAIQGSVHPDVGSFDPGAGAVDHCAALQFARFENAGTGTNSAPGLALISFDILPAS